MLLISKKKCLLCVLTSLKVDFVGYGNKKASKFRLSIKLLTIFFVKVINRIVSMNYKSEYNGNFIRNFKFLILAMFMLFITVLEGGEGVSCMDCGAPLIHASKT